MIFLGNLPSQRANTEVFIYSPQIPNFLEVCITVCLIKLARLSAAFSFTLYPALVKDN